MADALHQTKGSFLAFFVRVSFFANNTFFLRLFPNLSVLFVLTLPPWRPLFSFCFHEPPPFSYLFGGFVLTILIVLLLQQILKHRRPKAGGALIFTFYLRLLA